MTIQQPPRYNKETHEYTGEPLRPDFVDPTPPPKELTMVGFMARFLVLATLPHSDQGAVTRFGRTNGRFSYYIESGTYQDEQQQTQAIGLPYGTIPRLLLCWLTTEAVKTREREIELGDNLTRFMEKLDIQPTGGKWGSIPRLREQMKRFFSSKVSYAYQEKKGFFSGTVQVTSEAKTFWREDEKYLPSESDRLLFEPQPPQTAGSYQSRIVLGQEFFQEIITRPVPIDLAAVKKLRKSPLALDMYYWFTHRMYYLPRTTLIRWKSLHQQFGSNFGLLANFKQKFILRLVEVRKCYPALRVEVDLREGLTLYPSETHVPVQMNREARSLYEATQTSLPEPPNREARLVKLLPAPSAGSSSEPELPEDDPSIEVPF